MPQIVKTSAPVLNSPRTPPCCRWAKVESRRAPPALLQWNAAEDDPDATVQRKLSFVASFSSRRELLHRRDESSQSWAQNEILFHCAIRDFLLRSAHTLLTTAMNVGHRQTHEQCMDAIPIQAPSKCVKRMTIKVEMKFPRHAMFLSCRIPFQTSSRLR